MHWNWSELCGRGYNSLDVWSHDDFGHCFEQLVFNCTTHALLAVTSAFCIGKLGQRNRRTGCLQKCWALHARLFCASSLVLLPVLFTVLTRTLLDIQLSLIDIVAACVSSASWLVHSVFVGKLHCDFTNSLRGPGILVSSFFLVFAAHCIQLRTIILHVTHHTQYLNEVEEYVCFVAFGLLVLYVVTLIPSKRPNFAQQGGLSVQVSASSREEESLLGSSSGRTYGTQPPLLQPDEPLGVAEDNAGCLSRLFFCWVNVLMHKGSKESLAYPSDLHELPKSLNTASLEERFKSVVSPREAPQVAQQSTNGVASQSEYDVHFRGQNEESSQKLSLFQALNKVFGWHYYPLGGLKLLADLLGFCGPLLLNLLVSYMENPEEPVEHGYLYASGLFLSTFIGALLATHFAYQVQVC